MATKNETNTLKFALVEFWKNIVGYGRSSRAEFWWAMLFYYYLPMIVLTIIGEIVFAISHNDAVMGIFALLQALICLATIVPMFCVSVRRLHDAGHSAWNLLWLFLPVFGWIVLLVFWVEPSEPGKNKYGEALVK